MDKRSMTKSEIEKYRFHNEKYNVTGSWICSDSTVDIMFFYDGEQYCIPFKAIFDKNNVEWLMEAAIMMIESEIESFCFSALEAGLLRYLS